MKKCQTQRYPDDRKPLQEEIFPQAYGAFESFGIFVN